MNARARQILTGCLAASVSVFLPVAHAQPSQPVQDVQYAAAQVFTQQELDQMLAPIALYPDSLLTQILMASTYPLEVVQAARWSRSNPGIRGEQAVRAVEPQNWDPSVKSLVAFPQVLELMDSTLDWTERLGNAFLSQESEVWDAVQNLRQRADSAGNLLSNEQIRVDRDGPTYVIESPRPDIIYVPYYDPLVVYGDWWWPGYAPMRWSPWPGYYSRPGFGRSYYYGSGISIGFGFFFGGIDWRLRHVNVINHNSFYYRNVNRRPSGNRWQHDPDHRRGVPYRNPALRQQFNRGTSTPPDARRDYRGWDRNTAPRNDRNDRDDRGQRGDRGDRPGRGERGQAGPVPPVAPAAQGAANTGTAPRQSTTPGVRQSPNPQASQGGEDRRRGEQRPQALDGVGNGRDARNASARGQASSPRPPIAQAAPVPQAGIAPQRPPMTINMQPSPPQAQPQIQRAPAPVQQQVQPERPERQEQSNTPGPRNNPRQRLEQQK